MKRILTISLLALLAVGCQNKPKPDPVITEYDNYYTYENTITELKWAGTIDYDQYFLQEQQGIGIFLSAEAPEYDSLHNAEALKELIYINITPDMVGKTIDVAKTDEEWTFEYRNTALGTDYSYSKGSSITGKMTIDIKSGLVYVSLDLRLDDGKKFIATYKDAVKVLGANFFGGTITGNDGVTQNVDIASFDFMDYMGDAYYIMLDVSPAGIPQRRLEFVIPAEFVNDTLWLSSESSPIDRIPWSFKYSDFPNGITYTLNETSLKNDIVAEDYILLVVYPESEIFHIEMTANPIYDITGTISCNYTGSYARPEEEQP